VNVDTGEFAALRDQVDSLAAEVAKLREQAFMLRTIEEMWLEHCGYPVTRGARTGPRPRHLRPVDGGQQS